MNYQKAATYWEEKDARAVKMEPEVLLLEMKKFIAAHNTCALATSCEDFVRCTPIEYSYIGEKFWLLSEGGQKFRALEHNKNVCLAIYDSYSGFNNLGGMQITGKADLVEPWSKEYIEVLTFKKLPVESLKKLPQTLYLIQVTPSKIEFLCSDFKKMGYDTRQSLTFASY